MDVLKYMVMLKRIYDCCIVTDTETDSIYNLKCSEFSSDLAAMQIIVTCRVSK